jgi:hypothetical protein
MKDKPFTKLLTLLERLDEAEIHYTMEHSRDDAIMVIAWAPGEYWEIECLADGTLEIERFRSNGKVEDESVLEDLFALCSDVESSPEEAVNHNDATTRT